MGVIFDLKSLLLLNLKIGGVIGREALVGGAVLGGTTGLEPGF